ncbi:MAG TPA: hypothetical protein VLG74_14330 [Blastocatellia bacterium]|nr:hypothetical protein [Blastocatellia bacterium]
MNSQRKSWIAFLIVFALGGVTGASLDGLYRLREGAIGPTAVSIRDTDAYFETLKRELRLTDDQSSAMRAILDQTRDDYKAVCADVRPRYDVVRERARTGMRALLTADQQPRFDSIVTAEDCRCPELKK